MIVNTAELKEQVGWTDLIGDVEALMTRKIAAAQGHIESLLGFKIETTYPGPELVPADLKEAVILLAAHWYENREASVVGVSAQQIPFGVEQIVNEHREYSFDGE